MKKSNSSTNRPSIDPGLPLRQKAEAKLKQRKQKNEPLNEADTLSLIHELQVHQIELEMQNEELTQARAEAEEAYRQYTDLYDFAPVGYLTLARDGTIRKINLAGTSLLGVERVNLVNRRLGVFVDMDYLPVFNAFLKNLLSRRNRETCEIRFLKNEAKPFWARLEATCFNGSQESRVVMVDITERKIAEEHLEKFKQIVASTSEGISLLDRTYRYVIVNKAYETFSGKRKEELIGVTVAEYLGEAVFYEQIKPQFDQCLNGETIRFQNWFEYPTLGKRFVEVTYYPYIDARGAISGVVANTRDITKRKQAEMELIQSEAKFRSTFDQSPVGSVIVGLDKRFIRCNPAFCNFLGYPESELIGKTISDITHPEDLEIGMKELKQMVEGEIESFTAQKRYLRKDGAVLWGEISIRLVCDANDEPLYFLPIIQNITERKQAEEELLESEEKYRRIVETAGEGIWMIDTEGNTSFANQKMAEMLGCSVGDMLGVSFFNFMDEDGKAIAAVNLERRRQGIKEQHDFKFRRKDGTDLWAILETNPIRDRDGRYAGALAMITDITERKRVENELEESHRKLQEVNNDLQQAQSIAHIGNWRWDLRTSTVEWSDEMYRIFGIDKDSYSGRLGDAISKVIHPDDLYIVLPSNAPEFAMKKPQEYRIIHPKNGDVRHIWAKAGDAVLDEQGTPIYLTGIAQDITERKQAEEKLRESETRYRTLLESTSDSVYVLDREWRHIMVNEAATRFVQMPKAKLLDNKLTDLFPGIEETVFFKTFQRVMETRESDTTVAMYTFPDGNKGWYEVRVDPTPEGILCISRDITERKQAEDELHVALVKYKALFDCFPLGITVSNEAGNILETNSMAGRLLNVPGEEHMRRNIDGAEWKIVRPDGTPMPPNEFASVKALKEKRVIENVEMGVIKADNSITWISVNAAPLPVEGYGVVVTYGDITERKQAEEEIRQLNATLERRVEERTAELLHANRAKDDFLANMSHELRTPLNGILGFAEMLLQGMHGSISEKQAQDLEIIYSSGQHLLGLITDILDIAKIEAGNFETHREVVPLNSVCQSSLVFIKQLAQKKSISVEYSPAAPAATIFADPKRLKQILVNLLNNAVKFTPEHGNIKLEVWEDLEASQVHFSVTDTGIGIAPEDLQKLFKPFVQLDSSLSRQHEGAGLGLSLVKKLVELHGGSIEVESELGRGSCFRVSIPIGRQNIPVKAAPVIASQDDIGKTAIPVQEAGNKRILITEDNSINRMVMSDFLASKGHEVIEAENGMEAIEKARVNKPAVILMDIQMPVMNGFETIKRLREIPEFSSIPIVALTALAMPGDRESCLQAGADEYLSKPVSLKKLAELIETLLQKGAHA